jgi:hypothetical protein
MSAAGSGASRCARGSRRFNGFTAGSHPIEQPLPLEVLDRRDAPCRAAANTCKSRNPGRFVRGDWLNRSVAESGSSDLMDSGVHQLLFHRSVSGRAEMFGRPLPCTCNSDDHVSSLAAVRPGRRPAELACAASRRVPRTARRPLSFAANLAASELQTIGDHLRCEQRFAAAEPCKLLGSNWTGDPCGRTKSEKRRAARRYPCLVTVLRLQTSDRQRGPPTTAIDS